MLGKEYYSQSGLLILIERKIPESIQLDYKEARAISRNDRSKQEISKDVSAFANSDGGIIIYGMTEKNQIPEDLSFIDGNDFSIEWLENVIDSNIFPKIKNLTIHPIRVDDKIEQTIYIVEIPQSSDSPHIANDKRFYRRFNSKSVPMEEYEIRNLYFKTVKAKLELEDFVIKTGSSVLTNNKLTRIKYSIDFSVRNIGKAIESLYKLEVHVPTDFYYLSSIPTEFDKKFNRREDRFNVYSIPNSSPLFQNEVQVIYSVAIEINENNFMALDSLAIKAILYYSSGVEIKEIQLSEKLQYSGKILTPSDFLNYRG